MVRPNLNNCESQEAKSGHSEGNTVSYPVENIVRAGVDHLDHNVGVEKVGGDHVRYEGSVFFLEHDGNDVIPYVPLSL